LHVRKAYRYIRITVRDRDRDRDRGRRSVIAKHRLRVRDMDRRSEPDRRSEAINFGANSDRRSEPNTVLCMNYGTFVPAYFRSRERKFHRWNFRSLELSLPGTFVPGSENDVELSLPNIIWNLLEFGVYSTDSDFSYHGRFVPWTFRTFLGLFVPL